MGEDETNDDDTAGERETRGLMTTTALWTTDR